MNLPEKIFKGSPEYFALYGEKERYDETPSYVMMNLETKCSYTCPKCALPGYRRDMRKALSFEQRKDILTKMKDIGVRTLVIIGAGEPTEHFELLGPIIKAARENTMNTIMFTTASHLDDEQIKFYKNNDVSIFLSLDSLNPDTYRELTGKGDLVQVLKNIRLLRNVYKDTVEVIEGKRIVRLGIDVTVVKQNKDELDAIKEFSANDMKFIANYPIKQGKFASSKTWEYLVGDSYEEIRRFSQDKSETGGHTSMSDGVCNYFYRGISVDIDGQLLSCAYASETADSLDVIQGMTSDDLKKHYQEMRLKYVNFTKKVGKAISCPIRGEYRQEFFDSLK